MLASEIGSLGAGFMLLQHANNCSSVNGARFIGRVAAV
jgi:hypothetical protein